MNKEINREMHDLYEVTANVLFGDKLPVIQAIENVCKLPHLLHNIFFIRKLDKLLSGVASISQKHKLSELLVEKEDREEFTEYIISAVDKIEIEGKVQYILNALQSLCNDYISKEEFYRMLHLIIRCLNQDLVFMALHIHESNIAPNDSVYGLLSDSLMYNSTVTENEGNRYSFVPFAYKMVQNSINYETFSNTYDGIAFSEKINNKVSTKIEYSPEALYRDIKGEYILHGGSNSSNGECHFSLVSPLNKFKRLHITVKYKSDGGNIVQSELKSKQYPENFSKSDIGQLVSIPIKGDSTFNATISSLDMISISLKTSKRNIIGYEVEIIGF